MFSLPRDNVSFFGPTWCVLFQAFISSYLDPFLNLKNNNLKDKSQPS